MNERLTTLPAVKEWLDITSDDADSGLTRIIDSASQFVLGYLNRDSFRVQEYTQNFRGNGKQSALIRNWPILSVSSVGIAGTLITEAVLGTGGLPGPGYRISDLRQAPQSLDLYSWWFCLNSPCQVIYTAGFRTSQSTVIPETVSPATVVTITPQAGGCWSQDLGVTIDSVDAILVTGDPSAGEYAVDEWGTYTFSAADSGKLAVMSYDYTPWGVSFAVTELIGEWYKRKDRIGVISKTLGGQETVVFSQKDMNDSIRSSFQLYANVVPV